MDESELTSPRGEGGDVEDRADDASGRGRDVGSDEVVRGRYEWSSTRPSTAVIESVAAAADRAPTELEPLYNYVDPDALDALVRAGSTQATEGVTTLVFRFDGYDVTVYSDGEVVVEPAVPFV